MCVWMSSSAMENANSPRSISAGDVVEGGDDLLGLVGGEQADLGEHAGVGLAGEDVVAVEPAVEADRFGEGFDAVVGVAAEAAAPGLLAHGGGLELFSARATRRSLPRERPLNGDGGYLSASGSKSCHSTAPLSRS